MDANETHGRLLALEALLTEVMTRMQPDEARAAVNSALSPLQRQPNGVAAHSTVLPAAILRRLKR